MGVHNILRTNLRLCFFQTVHTSGVPRDLKYDLTLSPPPSHHIQSIQNSAARRRTASRKLSVHDATALPTAPRLPAACPSCAADRWFK
jgi:hypothetical protein